MSAVVWLTHQDVGFSSFVKHRPLVQDCAGALQGQLILQLRTGTSTRSASVANQMQLYITAVSNVHDLPHVGA